MASPTLKAPVRSPADPAPKIAPEHAAVAAVAKRRPASFYILLSLAFLIGIAAGALALLWFSGVPLPARLSHVEDDGAAAQAPKFVAPRPEIAVRYPDDPATWRGGERDGFLAGVASAKGLAGNVQAKIGDPALDSGLQAARFDRLRAASPSFAGVRLLVQPPPDADGWEQNLRLRDAGFAPETLPAARFAPPRTVVQFFDSRDKAAAASLADALGGDVIDLTKFKPRPADRRVEVYLAD